MDTLVKDADDLLAYYFADIANVFSDRLSLWGSKIALDYPMAAARGTSGKAFKTNEKKH